MLTNEILKLLYNILKLLFILKLLYIWQCATGIPVPVDPATFSDPVTDRIWLSPGKKCFMNLDI